MSKNKKVEDEKREYHDVMMTHARAWIMAKTLADQRGEDLGEHSTAFNYLSAAYLDLYKEYTGVDPWEVEPNVLQEELATLMAENKKKDEEGKDEEVTD